MVGAWATVSGTSGSVIDNSCGHSQADSLDHGTTGPGGRGGYGMTRPWEYLVNVQTLVMFGLN